MSLSNMHQTGYTSCFKVYGIPILPPLITEERRKELNDDKQKAIEIEKKLKGKRSSIDSGVMTGSYIEHFRNNESQQHFELCHNHPLTHDEFVENGVSVISCDAANDVSDTFLKTALEDPEFREFFSSTAEKIFKDNKLESIFNITNFNDHNSNQAKCVISNENEMQSVGNLSNSSSFVKPPDTIDLSYSDSLSRVGSVVEVASKCSIDNGNDREVKHTKEKPSSPPPPRIRRNSYTLESPSPVLLEHLAKEIACGKKEGDKWQTLPDKKEKAKGPGFKTFSGKGPRKNWIKKNCNLSSFFRVENNHNRTKFTLPRSSPEKKVGESNFSLPCSSRSSPLQFGSLARSVDCIKTLVVNPLYELKGRGYAWSMSSESVDKKNVHQTSPPKITFNYAVSDSKTFTVQQDSDIHSVSAEISPKSITNNSPGSGLSTYDIDNSPPQIDFGDSVSQISIANKFTHTEKHSACGGRAINDNEINNTNRAEDFDDIASLCSSMSISRFLPSNYISSRPSTAEDLSEANIRFLKMKHENELKELLEKQRKEEEMYSHLLSASGSVTSETTTNLSITDPFESNSEVLLQDKKDSCSRELFPLNIPSPGGNNTKQQQNNYSEIEEKAATKLTAYAKGYLTRRLLKTERVQQLIELIKESLNCAFSLQLEPHLKPTDLELHARLAHQMTTALSELQSIVSAPVATRMAIIAADRERLRRPASRPSSTISAATRKSILRRQQSVNSSEKKHHQSRPRTKSFSVNGSSGSSSSGSYVRSDSASTISANSSRIPWR